MATTPAFLPGKYHGELLSMGLQKVRHDLVTEQQQQQKLVHNVHKRQKLETIQIRSHW